MSQDVFGEREGSGGILRTLLRFFGWGEQPFSAPQVRHAEAEAWDPDLPLVSVIIPCYNHGRYLGEAVDSVLGGSWQDLEIVVVDDGSDEPETISILDDFSRPQTNLVRHEENQGLPAARNTGIRQSRGRYICCLDADDKLHPTYLEKALCTLESNLGLGLVYAWTQVFGEEDRVWHAPQFDPAALIHHNQLNPPGVFRRSAWEGVGGFREEMRRGYEDWEFWIRLARAGVRGYRIPEKLIYVRRVGESFIHEAAERHDELVAEIKGYNPEVYEDTSWLEEVQQEAADVYVEDPWLNIAEADSFGPLRNPALWIEHRSGRKLRGNLEKLRRQIMGHEGEAIIVCTREVEEDLQDALYELTDYVYILPHFLPRYARASFVEQLLVEVRGV